jgi:hypothetical protein
MRENYCFKCGCYTPIDDVTKLCDACYGGALLVNCLLGQ